MNTTVQTITPSLLSAKLTAPIVALCSDVLADKHSPRAALYQIIATSLATHAAITYLESSVDEEKLDPYAPSLEYKYVITCALDRLSLSTSPSVLAQALVASLSQYTEVTSENSIAILNRLSDGDTEGVATILIDAADQFMRESFTKQFTIATYEHESDLTTEIEAFSSILRSAGEALGAAAIFCGHRISLADTGTMLSDFLRKFA